MCLSTHWAGKMVNNIVCFFFFFFYLMYFDLKFTEAILLSPLDQLMAWCWAWDKPWPEPVKNQSMLVEILPREIKCQYLFSMHIYSQYHGCWCKEPGHQQPWYWHSYPLKTRMVRTDPGGWFNIKKCHLTSTISIRNPIVEIKRSYDHLMSTKGFTILVLVRRYLYIESGPNFKKKNCQ